MAMKTIIKKLRKVFRRRRPPDVVGPPTYYERHKPGAGGFDIVFPLRGRQGRRLRSRSQFVEKARGLRGSGR